MFKILYMARIQPGPLGPIHGKVGNYIASSFMGEPYIKSTGGFRTKRRGAIEQHNQSNFALLHRWLRPLQKFVKEGFRGYAPRMHGYNAAKSFNLKYAFTGEKGARTLDPSKLQVSYGDLPLPSHLSMEKESGVLKFRWDPAVPAGASPYDQAMLLAYNPDTGFYNWKMTGRFREAGADELKLPDEDGAGFHVYIAFIAADRSRQSHSVYLGRV